MAELMLFQANAPVSTNIMGLLSAIICSQADGLSLTAEGDVISAEFHISELLLDRLIVLDVDFQNLPKP